MYRPNRIGPSPLVTLLSSPHILTSINVEAAENPIGNIGWIAMRAGANEFAGAGSIFVNTDFDIGPGQGVALGVKITDPPQDHDQDLFEVGGGCHFHCSSEDVDISAVVTRTQEIGAAAGVSVIWAFLPMEHHIEFASNADGRGASVRTGVVLGNFEPTVDLKTGEIFTGFYLTNGGVASATIRHWQSSHSGYRYAHDLTAFDPNR